MDTRGSQGTLYLNYGDLVSCYGPLLADAFEPREVELFLRTPASGLWEADVPVCDFYFSNGESLLEELKLNLAM